METAVDVKFCSAEAGIAMDMSCCLQDTFGGLSFTRQQHAASEQVALGMRAVWLKRIIACCLREQSITAYRKRA
jgi:hypothetical protein